MTNLSVTPCASVSRRPMAQDMTPVASSALPRHDRHHRHRPVRWTPERAVLRLAGERLDLGNMLDWFRHGRDLVSDDVACILDRWILNKAANGSGY